jgi:hypothetical protein
VNSALRVAHYANKFPWMSNVCCFPHTIVAVATEELQRAGAPDRLKPFLPDSKYRLKTISELKNTQILPNSPTKFAD